MRWHKGYCERLAKERGKADMYRGFNLAWGNNLKYQTEQLDRYLSRMDYKYDDREFDSDREKINDLQKKYVSRENASNIQLDGDMIEADCFPDIDADIFLSHSHADEPVAFRIKFLLEKVYKLKVFIDSCAWSYCNDLLNEIDRKYSRHSDRSFYDYDKRNNSTAIVHMMLSTALTKMMDQTECVFFLNTGNSNLGEAYGESVQTASPWIYHELSMTRVLRKHLDRDSRLIRKAMLEERQEMVSVIHEVGIPHLHKINMEDFFDWLIMSNGVATAYDVLDLLYGHYPESKKVLS